MGFSVYRQLSLSGHLSKADTSLRRTPYYDKTLSKVDTSLKRTPYYDKTLSKVDTSLKRTPYYDKTLSKVDTSLRRTPYYDKTLSKVDTSLKRTPNLVPKVSVLERVDCMYISFLLIMIHCQHRSTPHLTHYYYFDISWHDRCINLHRYLLIFIL